MTHDGPGRGPGPERRVRLIRLGRTRYGDAHRLQQRLQDERRQGLAGDTLLLTEHEPVITLGRSRPVPDLRVPAEEIALRGVEVVQSERGGDITYHGPGQLVAYGIIDLAAFGLGVHDYLWGLEETVIRTAAEWGVAGGRVSGARGVWVGERKLASAGLNVRRWVTMHGIALNVASDVSGFDLINPCGMPGVEMTSMSREAGREVAIEEAASAFERHFAAVFRCRLVADETGPALPLGRSVAHGYTRWW